MSATNPFSSKSSLSSRTPPPTPTLAKRLRPIQNLRLQNVRSTTATASSVFQRLSRCATSGLKSPNPPVYKAYNHGLLFSFCVWQDCATPRTEGPSAPARPKHKKQTSSFPRSSLSVDQSLSFFAIWRRFPILSVASVPTSSLGGQLYPSTLRYSCFALLYTLVLDYRLTFWTFKDTRTNLIVCTNRTATCAHIQYHSLFPQ